jgi:hypothetical protein
MKEGYKSEFVKIANNLKPVEYNWTVLLALIAITEGYALPVIASNIWAKKISRKRPEEVEEVETITENVKLGEKIDPKILVLLNKLEKCAKQIKNKSDTSESDTSRLRSLKQGRGAAGMESYKYYDELQQRDNRSQISQGAIALERQKFSVLVKELYQSIIALPPESQSNFNLDLLEKIKRIAESEPDKLNKQLEILRRLLPSIIDHSSSGNKDTTQQKPEMVKNLVQLPDYPKLESTWKSKLAVTTLSAITTMVAYNPYFARMNIAEPFTLSLFNQAVKSGDPIATDINEKIRLPTYKAIESGAIIASQVLAQIPGKFPILPNLSANERYDDQKRKAPLTGDPREQSDAPIHSIIGQEAYQKYIAQNSENTYIPDSSVSDTYSQEVSQDRRQIKQLNEQILNKSIAKPAPIDMQIIQETQKKGIKINEIRLDVWRDRVYFDIQSYDKDGNINLFRKYFLHPKLLDLLDIDSYNCQEDGRISIKIKNGKYNEVQKLFEKYSGASRIKIDKESTETKLIKLSDIEVIPPDTQNTGIYYLFRLPGEFDYILPDNIHKYIAAGDGTYRLKPNKNGFFVYKSDYKAMMEYLEKNGGVNYKQDSIKNIDEVSPLTVLYQAKNPDDEATVINRSSYKYSKKGQIDFDNSAQIEQNIPKGSFGVVYDFNSKSIAVPRFPNTSFEFFGDKFQIKDEATYLEISQKNEETPHYGKVLIIYTPTENKTDINHNFDYRRSFINSRLTAKENDKESSKIKDYKNLAEHSPDKLKKMIKLWRSTAQNVQNEKQLESLVTEIRDYIRENNNYGKSDVLNKIINDSDFKVLTIFKALAENMEKSNKENISCDTANFLEQVILSTMGLDVYKSTGYWDQDHDGILRGNEGHAWTVVALRNDKGYHKLKIFDATPDRKLEKSTQDTNKQFHYGPFVLVITGGVLTIWLAKKAKKSIDDFEELHTAEYPYPNNPPTKITELAKKLSPFALHLVVSVFAHKRYSSELMLDENSISSYKKKSAETKTSDPWFDIDHLHKLSFTNAELKIVRDEYNKIIIENTDPSDRKVLEELIGVICRKINLQNNLKTLRNFK